MKHKLQTKFKNGAISYGIMDCIRNVIQHQNYLNNNNLKKTVVWFPANYGFAFYKSVLTIHDLIGLRKDYPQNIIKKWLRWLYMQLSILNANVIVTPSNYVKKSIIETFFVFNKKIIVIYNGFDNPQKNIEQEGLKLFDGFKKNIDFMLVVSNNMPHKNIHEVIEAYNSLCSSKLVIVGSLGVQIQSLCENKGIINFSRLEPQYLEWLYQNCERFISTSFEEGFGIPAAYSRYIKKPLILRNIDIYQELHGNYAHFYDNKDQLSELMMSKISIKNDFNEKLQTWDEMAANYWDIFFELGR